MGRSKRNKRRRPRPEQLVPEMGEDFEAVIQATADLCERSGARGFEIGHLHEDVPAEEAEWYASAQFRGNRLTAEGHKGPADAAFALAVRILTGAKCRCGKLVALTEHGAIAYESASLAHDQGEWNAATAGSAGQCRWTRQGERWLPSCEAPSVTLPGSR